MLVLVQARSSSERLPGKVLRSMAGRPMLSWLLESLGQCKRVTDVVLATSDLASDDRIADFAETFGVSCFRGSLTDVAGRLASAAISRHADSFVRISGDSPLMDFRIVDQMIDLYTAGKPDLATNVQLRTFPKGFSVEAVCLSALERARSMMEPGDEEHVTPVFYRRPDCFRIVGLTSGMNLGGIQMSVDTVEDFDLTERIMGHMTRSHWSYDMQELVKIWMSCGQGAEPC